jgi:hypothetical protein
MLESQPPSIHFTGGELYEVNDGDEEEVEENGSGHIEFELLPRRRMSRLTHDVRTTRNTTGCLLA